MKTEEMVLLSTIRDTYNQIPSRIYDNLTLDFKHLETLYFQIYLNPLYIEISDTKLLPLLRSNGEADPVEYEIFRLSFITGVILCVGCMDVLIDISENDLVSMNDIFRMSDTDTNSTIITASHLIMNIYRNLSESLGRMERDEKQHQGEVEDMLHIIYKCSVSENRDYTDSEYKMQKHILAGDLGTNFTWKDVPKNIPLFEYKTYITLGSTVYGDFYRDIIMILDTMYGKGWTEQNSVDIDAWVEENPLNILLPILGRKWFILKENTDDPIGDFITIDEPYLLKDLSYRYALGHISGMDDPATILNALSWAGVRLLK